MANIKNKIIPTTLFFALLLFGNPVPASELHIAVASNFRATMHALVKEFELDAEHRVKMSFASSGKIYAQIKQGAPFHAFFSADQNKPGALEESELIIPGSRFTYAIGSLVLWSSTPELIDQNLESLYSGNFRKLALANPRFAPYGAASLQVLETLGLQQATKAKWVLGENIAQTLQFVSTGNADMGFIALAQLRHNGRFNQGSWWIVPSEMHQPIRQDVVLLPAAKGNGAARAFMHFLRGDKARQIMQTFGYIKHSATEDAQ